MWKTGNQKKTLWSEEDRVHILGKIISSVIWEMDWRGRRMEIETKTSQDYLKNLREKGRTVGTNR